MKATKAQAIKAIKAATVPVVILGEDREKEQAIEMVETYTGQLAISDGQGELFIWLN